MSVLIKGMQLPDMCGHCRFATAFECEVTKNFITTFNVRQSDCPLIEVPEPHGRLIDADAMIRDIEKSLAPSWYIKERNADMVKFLSLEDTVIPASESEERPAFLPTYELTPRKTNADRIRAMSDADLCGFICSITNCFKCPTGYGCVLNNCRMFEWLTKEAE